MYQKKKDIKFIINYNNSSKNSDNSDDKKITTVILVFGSLFTATFKNNLSSKFYQKL